MHIVEASADSLVFDVENVTTIRRLLVPIFRPGEMQSIYFMDRESDNVWRYYAILRLGKNANGLVTGNESSSISRAVAFYRHFAGISGILEPPDRQRVEPYEASLVLIQRRAPLAVGGRGSRRVPDLLPDHQGVD